MAIYDKLTEQEESKIVDMYINGMTGYQISKEIHRSIYSIYQCLKRNNIKACDKRILNKKEQNRIIKLYGEKKSIKEVAETTGYNRHTISNCLKNNNVNIVSDGKRVRNYVNDFFFDKIDSEAKAYYLGWLFADGWISGEGSKQKIFALRIKEDDKKILEDFKREIKTDNKIFHVKRKGKGEYKNSKPQYNLSVTSEKIWKCLKEMGMLRKEHIPFEHIPERLIRHFIRGLFDGDGCVWNGKRSPGEGLFYILASKGICEELNDIFIKNDISDKFEIKRRKGIYHIRKSSNKKALKSMYDFLYKDANYFLERKHTIWKEWMEENGYGSLACA